MMDHFGAANSLFVPSEKQLEMWMRSLKLDPDYGKNAWATVRAKGDYLEEFLKLYMEAQVTYSQVVDKRERAKVLKGSEVAKHKAVTGMRAFKSLCKTLMKLCSIKVSALQI